MKIGSDGRDADWARGRALAQLALNYGLGFRLPPVESENPEPEMAVCPKCLDTMPPKANFCRRCGTGLSKLVA